MPGMTIHVWAAFSLGRMLFKHHVPSQGGQILVTVLSFKSVYPEIWPERIWLHPLPLSASAANTWGTLHGFYCLLLRSSFMPSALIRKSHLEHDVSDGLLENTNYFCEVWRPGPIPNEVMAFFFETSFRFYLNEYLPAYPQLYLIHSSLYSSPLLGGEAVAWHVLWKL